VPQQRELKKQLGFTAAAGVAGFLLIALAATLYEVKVGRVFGGADLETATRSPVLATLPPARRAAPGTRDDPFTEAVDTLRTLVQKRLLTRHGQSLVVASAATGEGKSTVALHLALSLAQTSRRVLLVDADFRTPKLHGWLDAAAGPGLGEALVNERKLTEVLTRTAAAGLWFLPAGQWTAKVRQSLAQGQLRTLLARLKEDFDYVVIDSHATLAALDHAAVGPARRRGVVRRPEARQPTAAGAPRAGPPDGSGRPEVRDRPRGRGVIAARNAERNPPIRDG